jgi:dihydropteroate synthase
VNAVQFSLWLRNYHKTLTSSRLPPLIMGVLNVTPDSFYDGGQFLSPDNACAQALALISQGADIIDIGGESSKPQALPVSLNQEMDRVISVIEKIRQYSDVCISIDTYKPQMMTAAVEAGANIINDIYALRYEGALNQAAKLKVPICLMHMLGQPQTMQDNPSYPQGVMAELHQFFSERINACYAAGIEEQQLLLDAGFGFGKTVADNLILMQHLDELSCFKLPLLLGVSRKSTVGAILGKEANQCLLGSIVLAVYAVLKGTAILRVHDVDETMQALKLIQAIQHA